jgi:hypothetical protein
LDETAFGSWLDAYGRVWEGGDKENVRALYTEDVRYYETPFDEPLQGVEAVYGYAAEAGTAQKDIRFWHEPLAVIGDTGIARWGASFVRVPSGVKVELDGMFMISFAPDGRCRELREWWHRRES